MPDIRFLCIDDQQDDSVDHLLNAVTKSNGPSFERRTPMEVGAQIGAISDMALEFNGGFGLLLDLRLDTEANQDGTRVPYRGPTLAQELRTRMAEGAIKPSFPIVLWSIANKLGNSYYGEDTSHDLFDAVYGKDDRILSEPSVVALEMKSLVNGYRAIQADYGDNRVTKLLRLNEDDVDGVYAGFVDELCVALDTSAPHKAARLIMTQLILTAGLLAREELVALRLGVEISASGESWVALKKCIENTRYVGPFFEGWPRWWWFKVEDWWSSLAEKQPNLRRITAAERISLLNEKLGLKLVEAQPIADSEGRKFFTQCVATGQPLDPSDGLRVTQTNRKPWHDTAYVSLQAALARTNKEKWRIDPIDRDRLISAQESHRS